MSVKYSLEELIKTNAISSKYYGRTTQIAKEGLNDLGEAVVSIAFAKAYATDPISVMHLDEALKKLTG